MFRNFLCAGIAILFVGLFSDAKAGDLLWQKTEQAVPDAKAVALLLESAFSSARDLNRSADFYSHEKQKDQYGPIDFGYHVHNLLPFLKNPQSYGDLMRHEAAEKAPWIVPYMFSTSLKSPDLAGLSKWKRPISIGFDWPVYHDRARCEKPSLQDCGDFMFFLPDVMEKDAPEFYPAIKKQAIELAPIIEAATKLSVSVIEFNAAQDATEDYARIRLIPIYAKNKTLKQRDGCSLAPCFYENWHPNLAEPYLWNAVPFSAQYPYQLDGYLLLNEDSTVGMAVCKIPFDMGLDVAKNAVTECLLRATGLPEVSGKFNAETFLSEKDIRLKHYHDMRSTFTDLDMKALSLLYCDKLKSGMNKKQALRALAGKSCQ